MIYHFKKGKPFIASDGAPEMPTGNTFGDWIISSSNNRSDWTDRDAYSAFCNLSSGWAANNNTVAWIQWQNTKRKVLVKNYSLVTGYNSSTTYGTSAWKLEGSDDGATWTLIDEQSPGVFISPKLFETGNTTPYYYHRLTSTSYKTHAQIKELTCWGNTYSYPTSSGFGTTGKPLGYRSAKAAGCAFSRIPTDGLVFYAPLSKNMDILTGQTWSSETGTPTFEEIDGVPCAYFNGSVYRKFSPDGFPSGAAPFTISAWVRTDSTSGTHIIFGWGAKSTNNRAVLFTQPANGILGISFWSDENSAYKPVDGLKKWTQITVTSDGTIVKVYFNGVLAGERSKTPAITLTNGVLGSQDGTSSDGKFTGYVAACRIYNRVLTEDEIVSLSKEYKPEGGDNGSDSGKTYVYTVSGAGTAIANGDYWDSGETFGGHPVYTNGVCEMYFDGSGFSGITDIAGYRGEADALYHGTGFTNSWWVNAPMGKEPAPTVTEYSGGDSMDIDLSQYNVRITGTNSDFPLDGTYYFAAETGGIYRWILEIEGHELKYYSNVQEWAIIGYPNASNESIMYKCEAEDPRTGTWIAINGNSNHNISVEFINRA